MIVVVTKTCQQLAPPRDPGGSIVIPSVGDQYDREPHALSEVLSTLTTWRMNARLDPFSAHSESFSATVSDESISIQDVLITVGPPIKVLSLSCIRWIPPATRHAGI